MQRGPHLRCTYQSVRGGSTNNDYLAKKIFAKFFYTKNTCLLRNVISYTQNERGET